jgi:hypothetical protein
MNDKEPNDSRIAHHIISVASTLAGVCLALITVFKVTDKGTTTYSDEILSIASCLFLIACLLAYLSIRSGRSQKLEFVADILLFSAMVIMILVGLMMVFTPY